MYEVENTTNFFLHWDHQVYKALESSYRMGLESLNEHLPEIKCELIFTSRSVSFRPPLEELRSSYYREMRKFIGIPNSFSGFGNKDVYSTMADRNAKSLIQVYVKAEELFTKLMTSSYKKD
jgi:dynein heavy chain 2